MSHHFYRLSSSAPGRITLGGHIGSPEFAGALSLYDRRYLERRERSREREYPHEQLDFSRRVSTTGEVPLKPQTILEREEDELIPDLTGKVVDIETSSDGDEEAGSKSGKQIYLWMCLSSYVLAFISVGFQVNILGPTLPALALQANARETDFAMLFTAMGLSTIITGVPAGWLVDFLPGHMILAVTLILEAIGMLCIPFCKSVFSIALFYGLTSVTFNFVHCGVFTLTVWVSPKKAATFLNIVSAAFGIGSLMVPGLALLCDKLLNKTLAVYWLVAAQCFFAAIPFLFLPSPKNKFKDLPPSEGGNNGVFEHNRGLKGTVLGGCCCLVFLAVAGEMTYSNWIFTYATKGVQPALDTDAAAWINTAFWLAFTVGRIIMTFSASYSGPTMTLLLSLPFALVGSCLPLLLKHVTWLVLVFSAAMVGFGNATGYANAVALLESYLPIAGWMNGLFGASSGVACMLGPVSVTVLFAHTSLGYGSLMYVSTAIFFAHFVALAVTNAAGSVLRKRTAALAWAPQLEGNTDAVPLLAAEL